jgi:hypothetical protein
MAKRAKHEVRVQGRGRDASATDQAPGRTTHTTQLAPTAGIQFVRTGPAPTTWVDAATARAHGLVPFDPSTDAPVQMRRDAKGDGELPSASAHDDAELADAHEAHEEAHRSESEEDEEADEEAGAARAAGAVQRQADDGAHGAEDAARIHEVAVEGVADPGGPLPYLGAIQGAFGHHDVSGVVAHVGGAAARAAEGMGAVAYASGDHVAFARDPDLHLAAHEAAHVVQQRGGIRLSEGVGRSGDAFERHADEVADRVVRGESAEPLLDAYAHRGAGGGPAVQHRRRNLRSMSSEDLIAHARELDAQRQGMQGAQRAQTARTLIEIYEILNRRIERGEFEPTTPDDPDPLGGLLDVVTPFGNLDTWRTESGQRGPRRSRRRPIPPPRAQEEPGPTPEPPAQTPTPEPDTPDPMRVRPDDGWQGDPLTRQAAGSEAVQVIMSGLRQQVAIGNQEFPHDFGDARYANGGRALDLITGYERQMNQYLTMPNMPHNFRDDLTTDHVLGQGTPAGVQTFEQYRRGTRAARDAWNRMTPAQRRAVRTSPYRGQAQGEMSDVLRSERSRRTHSRPR